VHRNETWAMNIKDIQKVMKKRVDEDSKVTTKVDVWNKFDE